MAEVLLNIPELEWLARNSPDLLLMEEAASEGIYRIIYNTAPRTTPHPWNYRENFRFETRLFPTTRGYVTYIIAERFHWKWIEFGYTLWNTKPKRPYKGKYIMTKALEAYGYGTVG